MTPITQSTFDQLLRLQQAGDPAGDISHADLSALSLGHTNLSGTTIAMSRFPVTRFDGSFELGGVTWIGNELHGCSFVDVNLNKAELLDCRLQGCTLRRVSLFRADLTGSEFERCTLEDLDLSARVALIRVTMKHCTLKNVKIGDGLTINATGDFEFDDAGALKV